MKISRKELRKIILEAAIKEEEEAPEETEGGDESSIFGTIGSAISRALDNVSGPIPASVETAVGSIEKAISKDVDGDGDVGEEGAASGEESNTQGQSTTSGSSSKKEKIKKIQAAMQLAGAYPTDSGNDDGIWGRGTSNAWREFVKKSETVKRFKALEAQNNSEATTESRSLYEFFSKIINEDSDNNNPDPLDGLSDDLKTAINTGQAAKVAEHFGFSGTLTGVSQLIDKLERIELEEEDDSDTEESSNTSEEAVEETSPPATEENLMLGDEPISISFEKFKQDSDGNAIQPRSEGRLVEIDLNEDNVELPSEISKNKKTLKNFNRLFFIDNSAVLIKRSGKNYKLRPFKKEGNFIVQEKSSEDEVTPPAESEAASSLQESLSHGALIRRRYRRY